MPALRGRYLSGTPQQPQEETGKIYRVVVPPATTVESADIGFVPVPGATVPDEYSALEIDIERTLAVLKVIFGGRRHRSANLAAFRQYFNRLGFLALASLGQDQPRLGRLALTGLQEEVVTREAGRVKNRYVRRLGSYALAMAAPGIGFYFFCRYYPIYALAPADTTNLLYRFREFISMLVGSLLGTWLSFSLRRPTLGFWDLANLEQDLLNPGIRLIFVGGLTTVVGLLFATHAVDVKIGDFNTAGFLTSGIVAVLIGCLCGVGEQGLTTAVARRASDFVTAIGGAISVTGRDDGQKGGAETPEPKAAGQRAAQGDQHIGEIRILGWGSLLWDTAHHADFDGQHDAWEQDGPVLPLEFSRVSQRRKGALTLVIDRDHGSPTKVSSARSRRGALPAAIDDLASREGTTQEEQIGFVDLIANTHRGRDAATVQAVEAWAKQRGLVAAIWTDLASNFEEKTKQSWSVKAAIAYLKGLPEDARAAAEEYIRNAPAWAKTPLRDAAAAQLGWASPLSQP